METCFFTASTAAEPALSERPIEAHEKELSGSDTIERVGAWSAGNESTALMAMPEE